MNLTDLSFRTTSRAFLWFVALQMAAMPGRLAQAQEDTSSVFNPEDQKKIHYMIEEVEHYP